MMFKSEFLRQSQERGFIYQGTDLESLDEQLCQGVVVAYLGFDATATSLHVGNLVQIMRLRLLQRTGHKPIVLMGDGTSRVGDPSGKDTQRQLLSAAQIEHNVQSIKKIFTRYLDFNDGPTGAIMVQNDAWLGELNYLNFLRDYGQYFSVNRMLSFDSVKSRLDRDQPLSFLEFNYMILQAYDFLELYKRFKCTLQLSGADQWGNTVSGIDLIRRVENVQTFGVTSPLITMADGKKMGKTAQGAVWLNPDMLSPYAYWQFWRNTQDKDVQWFLALFTDLSLEHITELMTLKSHDINDVKIKLADEATRLCHGDQAVIDAHQAATALFKNTASDENLAYLMQTLPTFDISLHCIDQGLMIIDLMVTTDLVPSKAEARRLVRSQAVRIDDQLVWQETSLLKDYVNNSLSENLVIKVSVGKKKHILIKMKA